MVTRRGAAASNRSGSLRSAAEPAAGSGNKSDRIDAQKLAELLRNGSLKAVDHQDHGVRVLKELVRNYECSSAGHDAGDESLEGYLSGPGDCLQGS